MAGNSKDSAKPVKREKCLGILRALAELYPTPICALEYDKPHELLIAARLSAQCTDKRVNQITPALFARYPEIGDYARANQGDVEAYVRPCGLYKTKARDIVETCKKLHADYDCTIPDEIDELLTLPGIGRKTANLIVGVLYGKPAIVTDTHVIRLSNRLGLISTKDPHKAELALRRLLPENESLNFCHRLVFFGRDVCKARKPACGGCVFRGDCVWVGE